MVSISRVLLVGGGVLVLAGLLAAGFGFYEQQTNHCDPGNEFIITHLQPNETVEARYLEFENLSTTHQTALRKQLPINGSQEIEGDALIDGMLNTVVGYDDERYYIHRIILDDCPPIGRSYQVSGGVTAAVGAVIVLSVLGRRKLH